ncbi:MAG: hypothetical protein ACHRHE_08105 [Tepidisphaerales bacterium]
MSWFYKSDQKPAVANLCTLAGVSWVRDRLSWGEMEKKPGVFEAETRYDESARVQSAAGLRVLQVNHSSPSWYRQGGRFPDDLRDLHRFYREMARRWKGTVAAFEPWNEADIPMFGGHTGAEMASLQKAAYFGLKAGNPEVIACLNVFAEGRQASLDDLAANQAWAYTDTCNLHHYLAADKFAPRYAAFREISGGRPLWTSEFAMPVQWSGDAKVQEVSDHDLRIQADHLVMAFAAALHEGTLAYYFMLPHYVEGKTQFGIIRRDLTPRPAYLSLAAVGRLLADAKPVGRLSAAEPTVRGYVFRAKPDGVEKTVLVAWSTGAAKPLALSGDVFDAIGRPLGNRAEIALSPSPLFVVMPAAEAGKIAITPAPAMPPRQDAAPSPVVLQAIGGKDRTALDSSSYRVAPGVKQQIPIFVYNFGQVPATLKLSIEKPEDWSADFPASAEVKPGDRLPLTLEVTSPQPGSLGTFTMRAEAPGIPAAVLSIRLLPAGAK